VIQDSLQNWRKYVPESSQFAKAFRFLEQFDPNVHSGTINLDGEDVYAMVQEYDTRPLDKCNFEAHRDYADIQYIYEGGEGVGWRPLEGMELKEPFDVERDKGYYVRPDTYEVLRAMPGTFSIFLFEDAHQPCMTLEDHSHVRKVTIKVRYDGKPLHGGE